MLPEICSQKACFFLKHHVVTLLFLVVLLLPYFQYMEYNAGQADIYKLCQKIEKGREQTQNEVPFQQFLQVLYRNNFNGVWLSSIKESKLLTQQNGTIEIKTIRKTQNQQNNDYTIIIKIYDGKYQDDGYYQIQLDSSSIKTQQQFLSKQLIYESTSPVIGLYKNQQIFLTQKEKPIFINKLKFRLNLNESLKIQLLLAAEYQINIITQSLNQSGSFYQQIIFTCVLLLQLFIQAYGTYGLILQADEQQAIANSISPTFLKLGISFDTAQFIVLCYLVYYQNMIILIVPTYLLFLYILFVQPYLYSRVTGSPKSQNIRYSIEGENSGQIASIFSLQTLSSNYLQNQNLKSFILILQRNQNYLTCICSYVIFYLNNMQIYIYVAYFLILLLPQITRNCRISSKVNYSIESIITHAYPRLLPILYLRVFGLNTLFMFQPKYLFCFMCILLSFGSGFVLLIQKKHGARSILPKFLIPKGLQAKFKFFAIQDENITCVLCQAQLSQISALLKGKPQSITEMKQEITYNKVVLTPCHHKFHAHCLDKWMQSRVECPCCSHTLPPTQNQ